MIPGQASLGSGTPPVPGTEPCAWCGDTPTKPFVVQKGRNGTHRGRVKAVMQRTAPACSRCTRRLEGGQA